MRGAKIPPYVCHARNPISFSFRVNFCYTFELRGALAPRSKIPAAPRITGKGIRFPSRLKEAIEHSVQGKGCALAAFVLAAVRAAIAILEVGVRIRGILYPAPDRARRLWVLYGKKPPGRAAFACTGFR